MGNHYGRIASFYDRLNRIMLGRATVDPQLWLLEKIPPHAKVLIIGGGTGWILEELAKRQPEGLEITYLENASEMLARSKKRNCGRNKVAFLLEDAFCFEYTGEYDVVFTPFLLDNFSDKNVLFLVTTISSHLRPGGYWLVADFVHNPGSPLWQTLVLQAMYLFFRTVCAIEARALPDIAAAFRENPYRLAEQHHFYHRFIVSRVYLKR